MHGLNHDYFLVVEFSHSNSYEPTYAQGHAYKTTVSKEKTASGT